MGKDIVMVHGANCGGWCFDEFRKVFESRGFTCHAPDLIGHGADKATGKGTLAAVGMADYRAQLGTFLETLPSKPILLGHSMGAILAQQLAAEDLALKLVLASPAPRAGILPPTDAEKQLCQDLMTIGDFKTRAIDPNFDLACIYTLNRLPKDEQRRVFDQFGPESGRALFETFFWMFDKTARQTSTRAPCTARCCAWQAPKTTSCRWRRRARRLSAIRKPRSGSSKATGICSCLSLAPTRSRAASPTGSPSTSLPSPSRRRSRCLRHGSRGCGSPARWERKICGGACTRRASLPRGHAPACRSLCCSPSHSGDSAWRASP